MSDIEIFIVGSIVTVVWGLAVVFLIWGETKDV